jgi:hypothetical protein
VIRFRKLGVASGNASAPLRVAAVKKFGYQPRHTIGFRIAWMNGRSRAYTLPTIRLAGQ